MSEQVIENNAGQTGAGTQASSAAKPIAALTQEIAQLKEQRDAVILAHYYVPPEVQAAADAAYAEYYRHMAQIRAKGEEIIEKARAEGRRIIVLVGRPYHVDPEINHGIDKLICSYGAAVITEDSISHLVEKFPTSILNQWTYHSRLYAAAKYIADQPDMNLVQLVSFGCGVDAITTDELRSILEEAGELYTQLKIDDISNLGAVKIRIRSLMAALDARDARNQKGGQ